jgi:hypothetical protein
MRSETNPNTAKIITKKSPKKVERKEIAEDELPMVL